MELGLLYGIGAWISLGLVLAISGVISMALGCRENRKLSIVHGQTGREVYSSSFKVKFSKIFPTPLSLIRYTMMVMIFGPALVALEIMLKIKSWRSQNDLI
ncbi:MAG: hypothetical protein HYT62_02490 [Candidatus Yanofskybacteria bacterium]|nr:hypothetical protein [Candidatus Yanofskybacteria bacterium]